MLKKFTYALTALLVVFGMLAVTVPASALGNKRALKGTIVAIDTKTHTMLVAPLSGATVRVRVANGTIITRKGKSGNFAKLRVGDKVNLKYNIKNKQASQIQDMPGQYDIHGTVESVDTAASTVTVASEEGGNSVTLNVDAATVIERNGVAASLADLVAGDKVEAKYNSATMLASFIKTEVEDSDFHGTVAAIDIAGNTLTLTPNDGSADVVLSISNSTIFINNDAVIAFTDLVAGDKVEAEYDSVTMIASKIEVDNPSPDQSSH